LYSVKEFYEKTPFPGYEVSSIKTVYDLKKLAGEYALHLDRNIPKDAEVADVGCGTGLLCALLATSEKRIVRGYDFSKASIKKAEEVKTKLELDSLSFYHGDLFDIREKEIYDYVFCNGVLHHTRSPFVGFKKLVRMTRPGGYIHVGLYNSFSRFPHKLKRFLGMKTSFFKRLSLDGRNNDTDRLVSWYRDQFEHPFETSHTVDQVLRWMKKCRVNFINLLPPLLFSKFSVDSENIFGRSEKGSRFIYIVTQIKWMLSATNEGYFIVVGQKEDS